MLAGIIEVFQLVNDTDAEDDSLRILDSATITISIYLNTSPVAVTGSASVRRGSQVSVDVLSNGTDENGDSLMVVAITAGEGTETVEILGGWTILYSLSDGF